MDYQQETKQLSIIGVGSSETTRETENRNISEDIVQASFEN